MHKKTMMPDPVHAIITHCLFFDRERRRRRREQHALRMMTVQGTHPTYNPTQSASASHHPLILLPSEEVLSKLELSVLSNRLKSSN